MAEKTPKGLSCPDCRKRLAVSDTVHPAPGVTIRYRSCPTCGTHFKTSEVVVKTYPKTGKSKANG